MEERRNVSCGPFAYFNLLNESCECIIGFKKNGTNCTGKCNVFHLKKIGVKFFTENSDQPVGLSKYICKKLERETTHCGRKSNIFLVLNQLPC